MNFNSAEYSFVDIKVVFGGREIAGLRGIKYTVKHDKEVVRAAGKKPRGIAFGHKTYEGDITMLQSELEALILSVKLGKGKDVTDIHGLDIVVAYAPEDAVPTIDIVKNVEFTEQPKGMTVDNKYMEVTLPFITTDIQYGI